MSAAIVTLRFVEGQLSTIWYTVRVRQIDQSLLLLACCCITWTWKTILQSLYL